jgi:hypothetical protein
MLPSRLHCLLHIRLKVKEVVVYIILNLIWLWKLHGVVSICRYQGLGIEVVAIGKAIALSPYAQCVDWTP